MLLRLDRSGVEYLVQCAVIAWLVYICTYSLYCKTHAVSWKLCRETNKSDTFI